MDPKVKQNQELLLLTGATGGILSVGPRIVVSGSKVIPEDTATSTELGDISVLRAGEVEYAVAIKSGGDPDSKFAVSNGKLILNGALDFESKTSHSVTLEGTAEGEDTIESTFVYTVTNVVEAPVFTSPPVISGVAEIGEHIALATPGVLQSPDGDDAVRSYQWYLDGDVPTPIEGETDPEDFNSSSLEEGDEIFLRETATNSADSTSEDSNTIGPFLDPVAVESSLLWADTGDLTLIHMGW